MGSAAQSRVESSGSAANFAREAKAVALGRRPLGEARCIIKAKTRHPLVVNAAWGMLAKRRAMLLVLRTSRPLLLEDGHRSTTDRSSSACLFPGQWDMVAAGHDTPDMRDSVWCGNAGYESAPPETARRRCDG